MTVNQGRRTIVFACGCTFESGDREHSGVVRYPGNGCSMGRQDHMEMGYAVLKILNALFVREARTAWA